MSSRASDASRPSSRSRPNKPAISHTSSTPHSSNASFAIFERGALASNVETRKPDSRAPALEELLKPLITIKAQFSLGSTSEKPFVLRPLMLLARECLSLSSLDLSAPNGEFAVGPGRFFESHIRILDLEGRLRQVPSVLIARSDATRNVYAIERHQNGLYVVCKLGAWVSIEKLGHVAEACYAPRCSSIQNATKTEAKASATTPRLPGESRRKRAAIEELQSMVRKKATTASTGQTESQDARDQLSAIVQTADSVPCSHGPADVPNLSDSTALVHNTESASVAADPATDSHMSSEDIFQFLRSQYAEALYHSKGSLAYFAKGPLSRARTTFHFECDANLDLNNLLDFLKSLVVSIPQIDKKYKETVPRLVDEMKVFAAASDDENQLRSKRRKSKKIKLGKDGLWTNEVEHVKRWWTANRPKAPEENEALTKPEEVKYHISCLRTRETQLQMVILLEILALEAVRPAEDVRGDQLPGLPLEGLPKERPAELAKKKDKHDFALLLNLHADRMSIWQSTTLDEMDMIAAEAQAKSGSELQKSGRANSDPLQDFCIDIIVPFFAGRLPELCADLNKKLGGPLAASPPKSKKASAGIVTGSFAKPGSAAKRPVAASAPKSLERLFESDQQRRKASRRTVDPLARMRSATPAAIPGLKREASEPLGLERIPHGEKALKERPRNVISRSVSASGTEDVKAQKKARLEAELKEAISALKKPNRQMVSQSIADEAAKRAGSSSSPHPRKQKRPVRNAAAASIVQVKATPANFRFRDAFSTDSRGLSSLDHVLPRTHLDPIPSSSSIVPATAQRIGFRDHLGDDLAAFHIVSTPNKAVAPSAGAPILPSPARNNDEFILPSSPVMSRRTVTASCDYFTISKNADVEPSSPLLPRIFETPAKRSIPPPPFENHDISSTPPKSRARPVSYETPARKGPTSAPTAAGSSRAAHQEDLEIGESPKQQASSLYQQMGWDDDYGILIS